MKTARPLIILILIILSSAKICTAQVIIKTTKGGEPFEIPEIAALVIESGNGLEVAAVMPKDKRPEAYRDANIESGDKIIMINGQKVQKAKECTQIYEKLPVGGELKLGVSRNGQMFLISIRKADPKDLPKIKRRIIMKDGKTGTPDEKTTDTGVKRIIKTR